MHLAHKVAIFFQALGRSVGGLTTKIHIVADGNGLPIRMYFTEGKTHDSIPAFILLKNLIAKSLIADKAYDFSKLIDFIECQNILCVIPSRKTNLIQRSYDKEKYKERNLIERFFSKIKHFRRIATRYEKLIRNYKSVVLLGFIMVWIRFKDLI
jgi:putative transposase